MIKSTQSKSKEKNEEQQFNKPIRLNKFLADAGIASRRKADEIIADGKVRINGILIKNLATTVLPTDHVTVQGNVVAHRKRHLYILLNKPKDYISTVTDEQGRKTVLDLLNVDERIFPIGRLDRNTTGVLLLTNDGDLAYRLTHPKFQIERVYSVGLNRQLRVEDAKKIASGMEIDGEMTSPCELLINPKDHKQITMIIKEGKNREVRKMFESLGYEVKKLDRKLFAGLSTQGLKRGEFRFLERREILDMKRKLGFK